MSGGVESSATSGPQAGQQSRPKPQPQQIIAEPEHVNPVATPSAATVSAPASNPEPESPVLTKNARKKLARLAYQKKRKAERKEERRRLKAERRIEKRDERSMRLKALTPEQREIDDRERMAARQEKRAAAQESRARVRDTLIAAAALAVVPRTGAATNNDTESLLRNSDSKAETDSATASAAAVANVFSEEEARAIVRVCIDADWPNVMDERAQQSLARQIAYSYNSLRRAVMRGERPVALSVVGLNGELHTALDYVSKGWEAWPLSVRKDALTVAHEARRVVYLTYDAEEVLEKVEPGDVYVIGGLVDRNRLKGATLERAKKLGVRARRLSLDEEVRLAHGTPVLTVNHCVEILVQAANGKSWRDAYLSVLPMRKGVAATTPTPAGNSVADETKPNTENTEPSMTPTKSSEPEAGTQIFVAVNEDDAGSAHNSEIGLEIKQETEGSGSV